MMPPRVFLDSGVLIEGLVVPWSASRAVLILARHQALRVVLSRYVVEEVERCLLQELEEDYGGAGQLVDDYALLLKLLRAEITGKVTEEELRKARGMIRHQKDIPILVSALRVRPDWFLTVNTADFNDEVARKTGLNILTPSDFLQLFVRLT